MTKPALVSSRTAAKILDVPGPHVARLVRQGRLHAVEVEGTTPVYARSDVQALARELKRERRARQSKNGGRSA